MSDLTVKQASEAKALAEKMIREILTDFESQYGVVVYGINIHRMSARHLTDDTARIIDLKLDAQLR
jgi:hypothetical protein